jgi:hypothetical protein
MAKVNIENSLYERAKNVAASEGYSSVEEYIAHAIENELTRSEADVAEEQVTEQLRGLGYLE